VVPIRLAHMLDDSCSRHPEKLAEKAYAAVRYRDWWIYIADDDQSSKATFCLLNILYSL